MAAAVVTFNPAQNQLTPIQLKGDLHLAIGEITFDTGDYASGGVALAASLFSLDSVLAVNNGGSSIVRTHGYWVPSTGKFKIFIEDGTSGIEAEHGASALTAQSYPVVVLGRKAA